MNTLDAYSVISLGGALQGLLFSAALAFRSVRDRSAMRRNLTLSALVFLGAYIVLVLWLYRTQLIVRIPEMIGTQTPTAFLFGPLFYLFVRSWLRNDRLRKSDWLHFLPFLAYVIYLWPIYSLPADMKIEGVLGAFYSDAPGFRSVQTMHMTALLAHLAAYVGGAWRMCRHDGYSEVTSIRSAFILIAFIWLVLLLRFILTSVTVHTTAGTVHIIPTLIALALSGIAISALRPVPALTPAKDLPVDRKVRSSAASPAKKPAGASVGPSSPADPGRLLDLMRSERLYLDADLTLGALAEHMQIRPDQLSKLLNEALGESFSDFVNRHRVSYAADMLTDGRYTHFSIAAIAIESGFRSRSAFYRAFKQFLGTTPGEFQHSACPDS